MRPFWVTTAVVVAATLPWATADHAAGRAPAHAGAVATNAATPSSADPLRRAGAMGRGRFTLEHALTLASFSELTWSRDSRRLAFVVNAPDTAENTSNQDLWLVDLDRPAPLRLTRHARADFSPTFSPGGDTLAFIGARATGEDAKNGIYMLSLRGGEPWLFGSYDESLNEVSWSPDGRWFAVVKIDTLSRAVREWRKKKWDHVVADRRLQYPHLWVVEVATGRARRLTSGEQYVWYLRWSPDSRSIAFLTSPTGKPDDENQTDVGVVAVSGGPMRKLGVIGGAFEWSPDGRWIALAASGDRSQWIAKEDVCVVPVAGGKPINLTAGFDEDGKTPAWNRTSDTLYFHAAQRVTSVLAAISVPRARTGDGGRSSVALLTDRGAESGTPVTASSGRIAWVQSSPTEPPEIWIADHPRLPGRAWTRFHESVARVALGTTRAISWRSSDGTVVEGLLVRPPGAPSRAALRTLVQLHGGPYATRAALGFQPLPQYFAAHGYQVLMPNFRSSGGYGAAFKVRSRSDWGGQDWRDVASGVDSLVRSGLAAAHQLGVYGRSYGGYLTAWAITQTTRFDAACVFAGAVDLASHYGQSDIQKYRAFDFQGFPWETPENWARSSPITHIAKVRTPTLIQVGENDARVPLAQSQELYRALLGLEVPVEFAHYPREGHTLREPRHRADHMMRMLAWWNRWVQ